MLQLGSDILSTGLGIDPKSKVIENIPALKGKRILVVEDNGEMREYLSRFMRYFGLHVDFADNGLKGLWKARESRYFAVLMDLQMPVMDGYEAARTLREEGYKGMIIAVTAQALDERKSKEAGFNEILQKPVNRIHLLETIARLHLRKQAPARPPLH